MRAALLLLALALAPPCAQAQAWPVPEVGADLDGDGEAELYTLLDRGADGVDLSVETAQGFRLFPAIAWSGGGAGQVPGLALGPTGSLLIGSGNVALGRDRWNLTLTVAHRGGDLRVAGIAYEWWDTLDPAAGGSCDVNLLSGRGAVATAEGRREVRAPWPAPRLADWRGDAFDAGEVCGL